MTAGRLDGHSRKRPRAVRGALVLLAALGTLVACGSEGGTAGEETSVSPPTTATVESTTTQPLPASTEQPTTTLAPEPLVPAGGTYVALGSSFAAGFGIPVQAASCGRSDHNYPSLVAADLALNLIDVTCIAATTDNLIDVPQGDAPPQVDALTPDTALVTITAGGNDLGYSALTLACATPDDCTSTFDRSGFETATAALPIALDRLFTSIKERAPQATIVLVTYPVVIPADACDRLSLDPAEATLIAEIGTRLESVFVDAAMRNDVLIADPYPLGAGHGPCDPADQRWVEGAVSESPGFAFHPTAIGHMAMARLVEDVLQG